MRKFLMRKARYCFSGMYASALQLLHRVDASELFDQSAYCDRDVAEAGYHRLGHYLLFGAKEGRNPHPLFDTKFYLEQYPDVAERGINPLLHYLKYGAREGRRPHALFDPRYYVTDNSGLKGRNPLIHFLTEGGLKGRSPHPCFDAAYYLAQYPDVQKAGINPLVHWILYGWREHRNPNRLFQTADYVANQPDLPAGLDPLSHSLIHGGRLDSDLIEDQKLPEFLPVSDPTPAAVSGTIPVIDVIVPVYEGAAELTACLDSLFKATCTRQIRIVAVNDRSPNPEINAYLRSLADTGRISLIENQTNLGFPGSVNSGMSFAACHDVVLLNSDTVVANDWLDRLEAAAYSAPQVGTVTPFSNNATICSYPRPCEDNELPDGVTVQELDHAFRTVNAGRTVEIPTAVGFCMYIRRDCLDEIGLFDAERFGSGYGEENDFCMRAARGGWTNLLAADVFVYHSGQVSFAERSAPLRETAMRTLRQLHPDYEDRVARHVREDPAKGYRFAVTAHRLRTSGKPIILTVTHALGGGVRQHIDELREATAGLAHLLVLQPSLNGTVSLGYDSRRDGFKLRLRSSRYETLLALLRSCGVTRVHVHHLLGHTLNVRKLAVDLNVPVDFTVHDYHSICPRVNLTRRDGRYCGEPDEDACNECIHETSPRLGIDIASWRAKHGWLLTGTTRVIAPSDDVARRIARYYTDSPIVVAAHVSRSAVTDCMPVDPRPLAEGSPLRIAVLGVMTHHKGLHLLQACGRIALERKLAIEFTLIGYVEPQIVLDQEPAFRETGRYELDELPRRLAEVRPHAVWFPVRWPETFSYTLSTCLEMRVPVIVPAIGALPERVAGREGAWVLPWDLEPDEIIDFLLRLRAEFSRSGVPAPAMPAPVADRRSFYPEEYLRPRSRARLTPPRSRVRVAALASARSCGQFEACGYIRLIRPLSHPALSRLIELSSFRPEEATAIDADIVVVQRTSVPDRAAAESLLEHCAQRRIKLIYDIDDDLLDLPSDHPDFAHYEPRIDAARLIVVNANAVIVSTAELRSRMLPLNSEIVVLPNALDEKLWFQPDAHPGVQKGSVRVLYMGTASHASDLELLRDPMRIVRRRFPNLTLELLGVLPEASSEKWLRSTVVPPAVLLSYPSFARWIRTNNVWTVGVAPLRDTRFNRAKSYMKYLDYGALGLAGVYSRGFDFDHAVQPGRTGLLVEPDAHAWSAALTELISDAELRTSMGTRARADVRAHHTLAAQADARSQLWRTLCGSESATCPVTADPLAERS